MSWHELGKSWHDTSVDYCEVCGNLLIRRYWAFETEDGRTLRACREDDARLYARLLKHAPASASAAVVPPAPPTESPSE